MTWMDRHDEAPPLPLAGVRVLDGAPGGSFLS
jgi:hypothetical protein